MRVTKTNLLLLFKYTALDFLCKGMTECILYFESNIKIFKVSARYCFHLNILEQGSCIECKLKQNNCL